MNCKVYNTLPEDAIYIRKSVFVEEQGFLESLTIWTRFPNTRFFMKMKCLLPPVVFTGMMGDSAISVSYTHLDVYKRQVFCQNGQCAGGMVDF